MALNIFETIKEGISNMKHQQKVIRKGAHWKYYVWKNTRVGIFKQSIKINSRMESAGVQICELQG